MKKVLNRVVSGIVALSMLLSLCLFAFATSTGVNALISSASGAPGEPVIVTFSIPENPGLTEYEATIDYDTDILTLNSITQILAGDSFVSDVSAATVSYSTSEASTEGTNLFSATFTIKEGAAAGDTTVSATGSAKTDSVLPLTFTDGTITVTALPAAPQTYTVTVNSSESGIASADKGTYAAGESVTLVANANSGYKFSSWVSEDISFADATVNPVSFEMPEKNVTVIALFVTDVPNYDIVSEDCSGGSFTVNKSTAQEGDEIILTATPDAGYYFDGWTITGESENEIDLLYDGAKAYLSMPDEDITVSASFKATEDGYYSVTVHNDKGGTVKIKSNTYKKGAVVEVSVVEDEFYTFKSWGCVSGNVIFADKDMDETSFSMPANDVIITCEYTYDDTIYYTLKLTTDGGGIPESYGEIDNGKNDDVDDYTYKYAAGETVNILATPASGYIFYIWETLDEDIEFLNKNNYKTSFEMPADDVTVKALFYYSGYTGSPGAGAGAGSGTQPTDTILVSFNTGGGTYIDSATVNYGSTVMRPTTDPVLEGYTFAGWYTDPSYTTQFNFSTPVYSHTTIYAKWVNTASGQLFSDVPSTAWYFDYVNALYTKGIVGGMGNNKFSPTSNITRAQVIKILAGMAGVTGNSYGSSGFSDVKDSDWFAPYVAWAKSAGIAGGSNGKFMPNAPVSRQDIAVMISRYAEYMSIYLPYGTGANFADSAKIAAYASNAVSSMQAAGIIGGKNGNLFDPLANATRAEACKMIYVFMNLA